jgi:hypothetical protein
MVDITSIIYSFMSLNYKKIISTTVYTFSINYHQMPDRYPCNGRYIFPIRLTQRLWASGSPLFNDGHCRMRSSSADSINSNAAQCSPTLTYRPPLHSSQKSPRIKRPRAKRHIKPIRTSSYSQNTPLKRSLSIHRKHKKGKGKGPTSVLHSDYRE